MMLRIGNKGFTLLEVMITTAVLSLTSVLIYQAFFICLDAYDYYFNYLCLSPWADEQIWQAQNELTYSGPNSEIATSGEFLNKNKNFVWDLRYSLLEATSNLYKIDLSVSWQAGKRRLNLSRSAYAIYEKKD